MKYTNPTQAANFPYPDHNIEPLNKGAKFCMEYARAAFYDWTFNCPSGIFANNGTNYEKYRMYALGKQPNTPYKKWLGVNEQTNNTWMSVDWSIRSIISPYRDKSIARLMESEHGIVATPIDMLAKAELDEYYSMMKAKLAVRQLMAQTNPELANNPVISLQKGDPMDIEELEMRIETGEQFNRSKDAEIAIALGLYENDYQHFRRTMFEDLFDFGVAGYKEWLGDDNKAKFRKVKAGNVVTNFCRESNFKDMVHAGELIDVSLVDLAAKTNEKGEALFTEEQLTQFASSITKQWSNPMGLSTTGKPYDKFKCKVLDLEFYSYNTYTWSERQDKVGNPVFGKEKYNSRASENSSRKYTQKRFKCVYKVKWIVGTEYCYDFGIANDQKRSVDPKKKAETALSYKFYAYNFSEMKAQGFMERLIPYLDDYQLTMLKIQNFKNRSVPSGWWIDLDGLERTALNKGGKNMDSMELLQMFFETGVLAGRSLNADGSPAYVNSQPIIPIANTAAAELAMFYQDLINTVQAIERITGSNEISNGNPNPKTLVPGYEIAEMSTNHALYPMKFAEKYLTEKLAEDVLCRMQQGIRKGDVTGYAPYGNALNQNMLTFIKVSPDIAWREYGIMLERQSTQEEKQWLYQMMAGDIDNGFLNTSDAVLLVHTHNAKQAMDIWSYRVKKAKEAAHAQQMQLVQEQSKGNMEVAQAAEQSKQQTMMLEMQGKLQEKQLVIEGELAKEQMRVQAQLQIEMKKLEYQYQMNTENNSTKLVVAEVTKEAKIDSQIISSQGDLEKVEIAGEKQKEKQQIANAKPQPKSSSKK
jgi:hypothetical protein